MFLDRSGVERSAVLLLWLGTAAAWLMNVNRDQFALQGNSTFEPDRQQRLEWPYFSCRRRDRFEEFCQRVFMRGKFNRGLGTKRRQAAEHKRALAGLDPRLECDHRIVHGQRMLRP